MSDQLQIEERRGVLGWVVRHPKTMIALVLLIMLALAAFGVQRSADNTLARKIAAIRAKGEPVSLADLLARQRHIPDEENMLVAVAQQGAQFGSVKLSDEQTAHLLLVGTERMPPTGTRWSPAQLQAARAYLEQSSKEMGALHRG